MKHHSLALTTILISILFVGCSKKLVSISDSNLKVINREISSINTSTNTLALNAKEGAGIAIIEDLVFDTGTIELELKGENKPGQSFVGIAFNIQNDSTYEAVYFRPFNFQSKEKIRREHSIQYISLPNHDWRILRTNNEGEFEAEYERKPNPDEWFAIRIVVDEDSVTIYDKDTNKQLLYTRRLAIQKTKKIGLWTGHNSNGSFRNLSTS